MERWVKDVPSHLSLLSDPLLKAVNRVGIEHGTASESQSRVNQSLPLAGPCARAATVDRGESAQRASRRGTGKGVFQQQCVLPRRVVSFFSRTDAANTPQTTWDQGRKESG